MAWKPSEFFRFENQEHANPHMWSLLPVFLSLFSHKKDQRGSYQYINAHLEAGKKMESVSIQWCLVKEQGAVDTNQTTVNSVQMHKIKNVPIRVANVGAICPEMLWSLHPQRHSKPEEMQSWAVGGPAWSRSLDWVISRGLYLSQPSRDAVRWIPDARERVWWRQPEFWALGAVKTEIIPIS